MRAPPIVTKGRETGNKDGIPVHFKRRCGIRLIEAIKPESQSIKQLKSLLNLLNYSDTGESF